ncbi:MAG: putative Na+/H+ antiporter [Comamonadaceae bacterium]
MAAKQFERVSHRFPKQAGLFHLLGEVEVVFGFLGHRAGLCHCSRQWHRPGTGLCGVTQYTEPLFVFVVMIMATSKPILHMMATAVKVISRQLPVRVLIATAWLGLAGAGSGFCLSAGTFLSR